MTTGTVEQPQETTARRPGRPRKGQEKLGRDKVRKLVDAGIHSAAAIAEITGCRPQTADRQISRYIKDKEGLKEFKENRADIFAEKQQEVLAALSPEDIKKASAKDKATVIGILFDKERLERGESTSNVAGIVKILQIADRDK